MVEKQTSNKISSTLKSTGFVKLEAKEMEGKWKGGRRWEGKPYRLPGRSQGKLGGEES